MPQSQSDLQQLIWQLTPCGDLIFFNCSELLQFIMYIHGKLKIQKMLLPIATFFDSSELSWFVCSEDYIKYAKDASIQANKY